MEYNYFRERFLNKNGTIKTKFARWYVVTENKADIEWAYNANIIEAHDRMEAGNQNVFNNSEEEIKLNFEAISNGFKSGEIEKIGPVGRVVNEYLGSDDYNNKRKIVLKIKLTKQGRKKERILYLIIGEENFNKADFIDDGDRLIMELFGGIGSDI